METVLNDLRERCNAIEKEREKLHEELRKAEEAVKLEQLKTIDNQIPSYASRLERLKIYVEGFIFDRPYRRDVKYGFKKVETYKDDYYSPMADPLEWTIIEYNLLGMEWYLEIQFKYSSEPVKKFVVDWMEKNVKWADYDEEMYAFNL